MKRRQALQTVGLSPLAFALNCSGPTGPGKEEKVTQSYYDPEIETAAASTSNGAVQLITPSQTLEIRVENELQQPLNNIQVSVVKSPEERVVAAIDPYYEYMPSILFPSSNIAKSASWQDVITLYERAKNTVKGMTNAAIALLPEPLKQLPSHYTNPRYLENVPFVVYQGDWSFNELKETFDVTSSIFGVEESSSKLQSVLSFLGEIDSEEREEIEKVGTILSLVETGVNPTNLFGLMDIAIDVIEDTTSLKLDRDKRYGCYDILLPGGLFLPFFLPIIPKDSIFDIKDYISYKPGNEWNFFSEEGRATVSCKGTEIINGNELLVFESFNQREYYGFTNKELRLFGFYDYDIGNVAFKPSVLIGDNRLTAKRSFSTDSKIIIDDYPEITGSVKEIITCEGLEDVVVRAGSFGDCLKMKEIAILDLKNKKNGYSISERCEGLHWFARNVGKVLTDYTIAFSDGEEYSSKFELSSANVNSLHIPKVVPQYKRSALPHLDFSRAVKKIL